MKKLKPFLLPILGLGAWLTAAALPFVAEAIAAGGTDVYLLTPHAEKIVKVNKGLWDLDEPTPETTPDYDKKLMGIYGIPGDQKERIVFLDRSKLVFPAGKKPDGTELRPELFFLPVDKDKGENPWQAKTILFIAPLIRGGAVITGAMFMVLFLLFQVAAPAKAARSAAAG